MIGAAFYRFGGLLGIGGVFLSIGLYLINGALWGLYSLPHWLPINSFDLSVIGSTIGTSIIMAIVLLLYETEGQTLRFI